MKIIHLALLLSAGLFQSTFAPGAYGLGVSSFHEKKVIPGTFLVEFENGQDSDGFFADLDSAGVEYEVRKRFDSKLFKGASFKIVNTPDSDDVSLILPAINRKTFVLNNEREGICDSDCLSPKGE